MGPSKTIVSFTIGPFFTSMIMEGREFPGTPRNGTPFWEASHTTPINSWKFMGSLWEPYGKGVPFLGAPGNSLDGRKGKGSKVFCSNRIGGLTP